MNDLMEYIKLRWHRVVHITSAIIDNCYGAVYDKIYKVDFHSSMELEETGIGKKAGSRYSATHVRALLFFRKYFKKNPPQGAIIDVGCGKGRMLDFFSGFPFSGVDGLEYSDRVAEVAKENLRRLGLPCRVFVENAATFKGLDDYNYIYLFNPFPQVIMDAFVANLKESMARRPRPVTVFYLTPACREVFERNGFSCEKTKCRGLLIFKG